MSISIVHGERGDNGNKPEISDRMKRKIKLSHEGKKGKMNA